MLGGRRFYNRQVDSLSKVLISRPGVRYCRVSSKIEEGIVIPPRIERGPTDILKALASTVESDVTAFHYKYPDDPYLYPYSEEKKKIFALALESGKKSARWVFKNNPGFFKKQLSDPLIKEFLPQPVVAESAPTEESLLSAIENRKVLKSIEIYKALEKENHDVSDTTKQSLLELVSFYNCEERPNLGCEEKWFQCDTYEEKKITMWMERGFAQELFEKMDSSCPLATSTIIQGMLKHNEINLAFQIFEEAKVKKIKLSVDAYNMFFSQIWEKSLNWENMILVIKDNLYEMSENDITPNVGTLNALLWTLLKCKYFKEKGKFALSLMAEFENLNIEPCLGSYGYLLMILSQNQMDRKNYDFLCRELIAHIENKKFEISHLSDFKFFPNASYAISYLQADTEFSLRLLSMFFRNNNSKFIASFWDELDFFKNIILLVIRTMPIDAAMDIYRRYVFTNYSPNIKSFRAFILAISEQNAPEYLPEIWNHMKKLYLDKSRTLLYEFLDLANVFQDESSLKILYTAAIKYLELRKQKNYHTEERDVLSNILIILVKNGDEKKILELMNAVNENHLLSLNVKAVKILHNYGLSERNIPLLLESLKFAASRDFETVIEMANTALPLLEGNSKAWVIDLINKKNEEMKNEIKKKKKQSEEQK